MHIDKIMVESFMKQLIYFTNEKLKRIILILRQCFFFNANNLSEHFDMDDILSLRKVKLLKNYESKYDHYYKTQL